MNCNVRTTRQMLNSLVVAAVAAFGLVTAGTSWATPNDDATSTQATQDTSSALVQLNGDPLSTYIRTKPPQGKKIDFYSNTTKSYRAQLSALRNDYKQWLKANVPQAKVTGEFDISLNAVAVQLNGATLAQVAAGPQVKTAQYEGLYHPTAIDHDVLLISAPQAWTAGGSKGDGVKIAIVDTGIDQTHPCFSDAGYAAQNQLGDKSFTNNKVIAAKVFNNKTPSQKYTPEALQEHGTHVAGTAACNENTPAPVDGVTTYDMSGVAPRALLGNYNVFPGQVDNARSEDILNALEAAYADGFDVANMSLGGFHGPLGVSGQLGFQDLLTMAVNNLDQANMVVAVAAGNAGPGHNTIESPGSAERALTAGAATIGQFIGAPITPSGGPTFVAAIGNFETVDADLTAPLAVTSGSGTNGLSTACSAFPAGSLAGAIALVSRGTCTFSTKIRNAQDAGAVAAVVGNNVAGDPIAMGQDGTPNQPTIPAYMLSRADAGAIKAFANVQTTIGAALAYTYTGNNDIMAGFSSQGPTRVDFRVKPDVVAPGVNVLSSIPHQFCDAPPTVGCFAFFQGTSMASPHLAGGAAVVIGAHPGWAAWQVRSAVVNNADVNVLTKSAGGALETDVNIIGSGRENLLSAVNAGAGLSPVSVSFGAVPSGSGQTLTFDVTVTNLGSAAATFPVSIGSGGGGVAFSVSPSSVSLASGAWTVVTVTMTAAKGAAAGDHQATLTVGGSHGAVYTFIK
jgi:minor extracellular serine protease Vpr